MNKSTRGPRRQQARQLSLWEQPLPRPPRRAAPAAPYAAGSDTSRAAAESMAGHQATQRQRVLDAIIERGGATSDELVAAGVGGIASVTPRVWELRRAGLVRDSGRRRPTRAGRLATVWTAADAPDQAEMEG